MKNASGGRAAKGLNDYAREAVDIFYKTAGSVAETALKPLENYIDSAIGNSRKSLSYETKAEQIRDESGFGIKGSGAMEADILKYFIAKENAVRERFGRNGGSEKRLDEILAGIEFGYENSLKKMHEQMPSAVQEFLNSGKPSAGNLGVYIPDGLYEPGVPFIPDSLLVPDSDARLGGILKADIADNERKLGGAKPGGSLPDRFSVPAEHNKFGGVRKVQPDKVQYKRAVGGSGGKPIDGAKTEEIGEIESHFYDGLYKVYDVFVDRPAGELLGGIEKLAKYASDKFKEHPYFYTAAVAVGLGGAVVDAAFNNSKIANKAADYAKNPGKMVVNAASFIGGVGDLFKGNQPPVIDNLFANNTQPRAGDTVRFDASVSDPDGDPIARYEWQIVKDGKTETAVTPTPSLEKVLEKGSYTVQARAFDGKGASGAAQMSVNVGEKPKQPSDYDYYDADFKVGIMIYGDNQSKANVTDMFKIIKMRAPLRYAADVPYFPKNGILIVDRKSNFYAATDEIGLAKITDIMGGSENKNLRLDAAIGLLEELDNARNFKTGVIYKDNKEAELAVNTRIANDHVEFGLWNQEQADAYIKQISGELESGEYHKKYN